MIENDEGAPLSLDAAHAVYDVLEHYVGANSSWGRADFLYAQTAKWCPEYRFGGDLGFGGKFRRNTVIRPGQDRPVFEGWYVDCYREDETPERRGQITRANEALERVRLRFFTRITPDSLTEEKP